jgi:YidC/Oxa1 family membrane protein insertase
LKYRGKNDQASQMRQSAELQALYKKNDISMLGSFATFLTLPIMLAMWQSVQRLSVIYDSTLLGLNLGNVPMSMITSGHVQYLIIVLIVGFTQFFAIQINQIMLKRNPRYRPSAQQKQMNSMNYFMTVMIVWFALSMPTAMSLYWITTNIITIIRTVYIQLYHVEKK